MRQLLHTFARSFVGRNLLQPALCVVMYLLQACIMPYFSIGGVTPSLLFITLAVYTVGIGRLKGFWVGCLYGLLMQAMLPTHSIISMLLYPIATVFASLLFGDRTHQQLEYRRSQGKRAENISGLIRTPACCAFLCLLYHIVNIVYVYLRGDPITSVHISRAALSMLLTTGLCIILMFPMRKLLGIRAHRPQREKPRKYTMSKTVRKGGIA